MFTQQIEAEERAQLVKGLLCKQEDPSLIPSTHLKSWM